MVGAGDSVIAAFHGTAESSRQMSEAALRDDTDNADLLAAEAQRLHQAGQAARAEAICRQILAAAPCHGAALHRLGLILCARGDAAGMALLERAVSAAQPDCVGLFCSNYGAILLRSGHPDRAVELLKQAVIAAPGYRRAYDNLVGALKASGRP